MPESTSPVMSISSAPFLGDEQGIYRIHVVGNSGTGKTTLSAYLSATLNVPRLSLDEIAWKPGWKRAPTDEFRDEVSRWMAQHRKGWIIDGHYRELEMSIPDNATDIIWLDPPLRYYLPRLLWRTLMRLLGFRASCARGCEESWAEVFSREGIVWFCVTNHDVARTKYAAWLSRMNFQETAGLGGKMRRLDESRGELARWKEDLEEDLFAARRTTIQTRTASKGGAGLLRVSVPYE